MSFCDTLLYMENVEPSGGESASLAWTDMDGMENPARGSSWSLSDSFWLESGKENWCKRLSQWRGLGHTDEYSLPCLDNLDSSSELLSSRCRFAARTGAASTFLFIMAAAEHAARRKASSFSSIETQFMITQYSDTIHSTRHQWVIMHQFTQN